MSRKFDDTWKTESIKTVGRGNLPSAYPTLWGIKCEAKTNTIETKYIDVHMAQK